MWLFSFLSSPRMSDADNELRAELREFAHDGLVQLAMDLDRGLVKRGTWDGCVLSYRRGSAGSVDCDRNGRRGNAFTRFWDSERFQEARVRELVEQELQYRRTLHPAPGARPEPVVLC